MSEIKLLPCPFCGGEAKICGYYFIQCTKCGSSTLTHTNREEGIKKWNTRNPMQEIVERLEIKKEIMAEDKMMSDGYIMGFCHALDEAIEIVKEVGGIDV